MNVNSKLPSMLKVFTLMGLLSSVFFLSGCLDEESLAPIEISYLSIYHASPDAEDLDILINSSYPVNSEPFEYGDYSEYLGFYPGESRFKFTDANDIEEVLLDTTLNLQKNKFYSVFIANELSNMETVVLGDSSENPDAGKAMIRFVHLSPDTPILDVVIGEEDLFSEKSFKDGTGFTEVDAKKVTFNFYASENEGELLLTVPNVEIKSQKFYTIVLKGYSNPPAGNTRELSTDMINN